MDFLSCPLSRWSGADDACKWCDGPMGAHRGRFCSTDCRDEWSVSHCWPKARQAVIDRDGPVCAMCGRTPAAGVLVALLTPAAPLVASPDFAEGWEVRSRFRRWCETPLEVDHCGDPLWGRPRGEPSCCNHGGLRVLCHPCHVKESRRLANARWALIRLLGVDPAAPDEWLEESVA